MKREYDAALETGLFDIILFSYDDWFHHSHIRLDRTPTAMTEAVFRGWMMKPQQYKEFWRELSSSGVKLVTSPAMYEALHIFPNVYPHIVKDTARIQVYPLHSHIDVKAVTSLMPRFIVKDYVKSVKGTEFPVYFDQNTKQTEFDKWMEVFYHYRGDLLTGGICLKEYQDLKMYDGKTNEYRVYYIGNEVATINRNSLQGANTPEPPKSLIEKYRNLNSIFYTVDFAEKESGQWIIIETGDGSVSGLSEGQNYSAFYRALYHGLN